MDNRQRKRTFTDLLRDNPIAATALAALAGAIVASTVPTSGREKKLIRPIAKVARNGAGRAFQATKTLGLSYLAKEGFSAATLSAGLAKLLERASSASSEQRANDHAKQANDPK